MLVPVGWLREFISLPEDIEELADRLTLTGNEVEEIRDHPTGPVLFLKLTPNRADLLSLLGVAREIAAIYRRHVDEPFLELNFQDAEEISVDVSVEEPELCPRYCARVVTGITVGPSPDWMVERLDAAGLRSVNNVVDATNYVMLELGQPLHAFDLDRLAGPAIVVRRPHQGESLRLIDGTLVSPASDTLLICDAREPVAVAGVMGGSESEISEQTTRVLLEAACFQPAGIRRTARRLGKSTAASYRFERGVDITEVGAALDRAAGLIQELAGGALPGECHDIYPSPPHRPRIPFRPARCGEVAGEPVDPAVCLDALRRVGVRLDGAAGDDWQAEPPPYRHDLAIEEDLIEEVLRIRGYDCIPEALPAGRTGAGALSPRERTARLIRRSLTAQGFSESPTHSLVSSQYLQQLGLASSPALDPGGLPLPLKNRLSDEWDLLRSTLLPGLIQAARHNIRHGVRDLFLFEFGAAYSSSPGPGCGGSRDLVAGLLLGSRSRRSWNAPSGCEADFYTARAAVESLCRTFNLQEARIVAAEHPSFHPGRSAEVRIGERRIGFLGELHPRVEQQEDLPREVYLFELDASEFDPDKAAVFTCDPPGRFPPVLRDLAFLAPADLPSERIASLLREELGPLARDVRLFDVFTGPGLPPGQVSLAFALELAAPDRTLTDEEVDKAVAAARARGVRELQITPR